MYGDVECFDLVSIFQIFIKNRKALADMSSSLTYLATFPQRVLTSYRFLNTVSNSRSNISAHYDISNEMFKGFLSEDMTYSCGIFPDLDGDLFDHSPRRINSVPTTHDLRVHTKEHADQWSHAVAAAVIQKSKKPPVFFTIDATSKTSSGMTTPGEVTEAGRRVAEEADADADADLELELEADGSSGGDTDSERTCTAIPTPSSHAEGGGRTKDELYEAQMRKIHHIVRKADIRPGHRVLEIGSGWGALAIEAVRLTGCEVDTLTLSIAQKVLAEERIAAAGPEFVEKIRVHLMDYRAMPEEWEGAFDRFVSVEMIEAVGKEFLEGYWGVVDWALKKTDSMGVVQVITIPEASECFFYFPITRFSTCLMFG